MARKRVVSASTRRKISEGVKRAHRSKGKKDIVVSSSAKVIGRGLATTSREARGWIHSANEARQFVNAVSKARKGGGTNWIKSGVSREARGWVNSGRGIAQEARGIYRFLKG